MKILNLQYSPTNVGWVFDNYSYNRCICEVKNNKDKKFL
jgi:hypothetical protein